MERVRCERTSSGVDPPRGEDPMETLQTPSPLQHGRLLQGPSTRAGRLCLRGAVTSHAQGHPEANVDISVDFEGLPRPQGLRDRLASGHRPPRAQPLLLCSPHEDGDPQAPRHHCEAGGLVGLLRPGGRVLRPGGPRGLPRLLRLEHQWPNLSLRGHSPGLVPQPLHLPEVHGGLHQAPPRPRGLPRASPQAPLRDLHQGHPPLVPPPHSPRGCPAAALRGRLHPLQRLGGGGVGLQGPYLDPARRAGSGDPRDQGAPYPGPGGRTPGPHNRLRAGRLPRPGEEAERHCQAGQGDHLLRRRQAPMGQGQGLGQPRGEGPVSISGHPPGQVLPEGAARCCRHPPVLVRRGKDDPPTPTRSTVVDPCPLRAQRCPDLAPRGDSLPPLRLQQLRLGCCPERDPRGPGLLAPRRDPLPHHLEGAPSCASRRAVLPPRAPRTPPPSPRGQHGRRPHPDPPDVQISGADGRAAQALLPPRHQRDPCPPPLHPLRRQLLGRSAEPGARPRRLAAGPAHVCPHGQAVGTPHDRPVRLQGQPPGPALQRQVERRFGGGRGLPPPPRLRMARGGQLVQPTDLLVAKFTPDKAKHDRETEILGSLNHPCRGG